MNFTTYRIPLDNKSVVMDRLSKLERTADRLGIPFPDVDYGEPYRTITRDVNTGQDIVHWWIPVTLTGEGIDRPVSLGGWRIIGQFNHEYPKVILNKLGEDIDPAFIARFEEKNVSYCEHCNKAIHRNNTYVIENDDGSKQMLVGSNCMHHYVPHQKPVDSIMAYYMSVKEVFASDEDDPEGIYRVATPTVSDTRSYLRACFQVLLAGVDMKSDMFNKVLGYIRSYTKPEAGSEEEVFFIKALAAYEDAESEMFHMMLFIGALSENNDFNVRLKRMCEPGYHLIKDGNTVRWGASKYYDYIHRPRKPRAAANSANHWVGEVGEMLEVRVTFDARIFLYSSEYGDSYLYTFKTVDGNTITWKTSYMDTEFFQGDMILRGRVKELTEFKGIKQTQVTRAKLRKL